MSLSSSSPTQIAAGKPVTPKISEDWLALMIGLSLFLVSLLGFSGVEVFGWAIKTNVWTRVPDIMTPVSKNYPRVEGIASLIFTYLLLLGILTVAAKMCLRVRFSKFVIAFSLVFFIGYGCFALGHFAYIAATPVELKKFGIPWSLNLTGEAGFIVALLAGLVAGNFLPRLAGAMQDAIRPELYIKIAIVLLGATLGVKSAEAMGLAKTVLFRGLCAIVEAYLIYWALVYFVARKYFRFSREWAAPLASGISICGVSAAIATGAAIRARPVVPIMVSSLVVIFAVVELLFLPFVARHFLHQEPMVAGAWMGLAVKTDGAAVASGTITDSLIRAKAAEAGIRYQEGWMTMTATTVKVFIDMFIGIWSFILAVIWCSKIENRTGERVRAVEIWERFPKFILGYAATFLVMLVICLGSPGGTAAAKTVTAGTDVFRVLFFVLTFFTIGVVSNFRKLWEEGIGRLAAVYVVCLFGFIIWIGLLISWLFFHGVKPPLAIG
ncbi:MAG TPA: putative sulfate exporter family transporter [Candidatus Angelobacter sp.]|nr:putative sulfate exporter family transporter [Candidatus Angelobacter sp.]